MVRTEQVAWSKPQPLKKRELGRGLIEYALILVLVATMLGSATVTVGHQLSSTYASVALAFHP